MKKIITSKTKALYVFFTIAGIGAIAISCNKDKFSINKEEKEITYNYELKGMPTEYNLVGQLHNEGMESVFQDIKKTVINSGSDVKTMSSSGEGINSIILSSVANFCKTNNYIKDSYSKMDRNKLNAMTLALINHIKVNVTTKKGTQKTMAATADQSGILGLSDKQTLLMKRIRSVIPKGFNRSALSKFATELERVNNIATNTLDKDDARSIYSATSTAFASYQYWSKNHRKWYLVTKYPSLINKFNDKQLNKLAIKNSGGKLKMSIMSDEIIYGGMLPEVVVIDEGYISNGGWYDTISQWWAEQGDEIISADCYGALTGAVSGSYSGFQGTIWFGPEGAIVGAASGAITGAVYTGVSGSVGAAGWNTFIWN